MAKEIQDKDQKKPVEKKKDKKPGFWSKIKQFLKETKSELKKVVWPTPNQVANNTLVVVVVVVICAVFIGCVDALFKLFAGFLA